MILHKKNMIWLKKEKNNQCLKIEKIESLKFYYLYRLNLNILNLENIKTYYKKFRLINKFSPIEDVSNYKNNEEFLNIKNYDKLILIKKIIFDLGITDICEYIWNCIDKKI